MEVSAIISWKDKEVGKVSNIINDMWYFEGDWLPALTSFLVPFWRPAEQFHCAGSQARPDGVSERLPFTVMRTHTGIGLQLFDLQYFIFF